MTGLSGRLLGRYRLEALLGKGGMAEVYRAVDTKLGRPVAVKVIHAAHASESHFSDRFLREAKMVASLDHPNILPVYDFGEEDGFPYLVMPYMAGGTLRDRLTGRPFPISEASSWIRQLADALDAAHSAGILHRDVKPANVLLGKGDRLVLADFGIAKLLEATTGLTATGMVVGTPIYMAPEQAQGRPASPATDRYSLAVLAYELLAGTPPFVGETALSLMHQHVSTPAPTLTSRIPTLDPGIDAVFARALSKDPAERPPTGRALADSLAHFVHGGSVPAGPSVTAGPPTVRWGPGDSLTPPTAGEPWMVPGAGAGEATPRTARQVGLPCGTPTARPAPGLTSESTIVARQDSPGGRRAGLYAAAGALAVLLAAVLWRGGATRGGPGPPVPTAVGAEAPAAMKAADAAGNTKENGAAAIPSPTVAVPVISERPVATPAARERNGRSRELAEALKAAVDARNLLPPAQGNALEALDALKREYPDESAKAQKAVVGALTGEAERLALAGETAAARTLLLRAQALAPQDEVIQARIASLETARGPAGAIPPAPPPPAFPPSGPDVDLTMSTLKQAVEPLRSRSRPLKREDFARALDAAARVHPFHPMKDETRLVELYARGGMAYVDRKDEEAVRALRDLTPELKRGVGRDGRGRQVAFTVQGLDAQFQGEPWQVALAYGDARGDAEALVSAELAKRPEDARLLLARAQLRKLQGRTEEAVTDALASFSRLSGGAGASAVAEFLGDEYVILRKPDEAVAWYTKALRDSGRSESGRIGLKAAHAARQSGQQELGAELLERACRDGSLEACRLLGEEAKRFPRRRFPRSATRSGG